MTDKIPGLTPETKDMSTKLKGFWATSSKKLTTIVVALLVIIGGYFAYKNLVSKPNEEKAAAAIWQAEAHFRQDSFQLALNGDGLNAGFLKVLKQYGGTKAGNRAKFYAGACYLQLSDFNNAVKYLKEFDADEVAASMRTNGLLGDAYSELGKKEEAISYYKKAGTAFPDDDVNSPEYLFRAAMLLQDLGKTQEAITILRDVKSKYPRSIMPSSQGGQEIDKYLGKLGDTKE